MRDRHEKEKQVEAKKRSHDVLDAYGRFTGEWKDGRLYGFGIAIFLSGERSEGEWNDGVRHGWGAVLASKDLHRRP